MVNSQKKTCESTNRMNPPLIVKGETNAKKRWCKHKDYLGFKTRSVCPNRPADEGLATFHQIIDLLLLGRQSEEKASSHV